MREGQFRDQKSLGPCRQTPTGTVQALIDRNVQVQHKALVGRKVQVQHKVLVGKLEVQYRFLLTDLSGEARSCRQTRTGAAQRF
jgi:hypothetical protein